MDDRQWAIVERAGYEGERVLPARFASLQEACVYMRRRYDADELDPANPACLHVDVGWVTEECWVSYDY